MTTDRHAELHADFLRDRAEDELPQVAMTRRILAAFEMYELEKAEATGEPRMTTPKPTPYTNLERLHARSDVLSLTIDQRRSMTDYLLGAASLSVDPDEWDAAVERAIRFIAPLTPVAVS